MWRCTNFQISKRARGWPKKYTFCFLPGVDYFIDGQLFLGPHFPAEEFTPYFATPCIASIDDDTAIFVGGQNYDPLVSFRPGTKIWSYNFSSLAWKKLTDFPVKISDTACVRIRLQNGKDAVMVAGEDGRGKNCYLQT